MSEVEVKTITAGATIPGATTPATPPVATPPVAPAADPLALPDGPQTPATTPATPTAEATKPTTEGTAKAPIISREKLDSLSAEYTANGGKLTEATLTNLAADGLDTGLVNDFIAGQIAIAQVRTMEVVNSVGGTEEMGRIQEWAKANLSETDRKALNTQVKDALAKGDLATAKTVLAGVASRYRMAVGMDPSLTGGRGAGGPKPFANAQEMIDAMSDDRYRTDTAYRNAVQARVAVSDNI